MFGVDPKVTFFPVAAERRILTITSVGILVMASSGVVHDCMIHGCHCHASGVDTTNSSYRSITKIPNHISHATRSSPSREINIHTVDYSLQNNLEELADAYEKELIRIWSEGLAALPRTS